MKKFITFTLLLNGLVCVHVSYAGGFFEVGQVTLTDTIDNGEWVTITPIKTYVNPVIIAGPISGNNNLSLFPRVNGLDVGMQSPCESLGGAAGGIVCPPAGGWVDETVTYIIVEEGVWEFPDETELEAGIHNTATVRASGANNSNTDQITVQRTAFDSIPGILHTVSSFGDPDFITSTVVGTTGNASAVTTTQFNLALEGMEAITAHGAEDISWLAIESATGTNAGTSYNAGRTAGLVIDRREVSCNSLGHGNPVFVAQHNTMNGGNGSGVRNCAAPDSVHMDEDQVNDTERTGIPERVAWFAYDAGQFGNLVFLTATQTVSDDNGGLAEPGDTLTYTVTITNELNDFTQDDNGTDEMSIPLPPNTTLVGGSLTQDSGILSGSGPLVWNGSVTPGQTITLTYQVTIDEDIAVCGADLDNQATLHMDPNGDGINSIDELSDDPTRDDGVDTDMDNGPDDGGLADDDPTRISVSCAGLQLVKEVVNDNEGAATVTDFNLMTSAGSLTFSSAPPVGSSTTYTSNQLIVPVGSYSISEADFPAYAEGSWECNGGTGLVNTFDAGSITLANGDDVICSIENDDIGADLEIEKMVSDFNPTVGDTVTFTLNVVNNGPDDATNLTINDTVLAGFTFIANSMTGGDTQNQTAPGLVWTIASLPAGTANAVTLTYQAMVN